MECKNGCGRPPFRSYETCCTRCKGPDGPHAKDCRAKVSMSLFKKGEAVEYLSPGGWAPTTVSDIKSNGDVEVSSTAGTETISHADFKRSLRFPALSFTDKEGDVSKFSFDSEGCLVWAVTIGNQERKKKVTVIDINCENKDTMLFSVSGPHGKATLKDPAPGPDQSALVAQLHHNAAVANAGAVVTGGGSDLAPVMTLFEAPIFKVSWTVGQELEYYSKTYSAWIPCTVVAVKEDGTAVKINVKDAWISGSDASSNLREPEPTSPTHGSSGASLSQTQEWQWIEKVGFLWGPQEDAMPSVEAAKKACLENPDKYMGYTAAYNGSLVYVRRFGSPFIKEPSYKTYILSCKALPTEGLFEDRFTSSSAFPGGLEGGTGKKPAWAHWKRPGRGQGLLDRPGLKLFGSIEPNDLNQGAVGDCSLIAAIACLTEFPDALLKLFPHRYIQPKGKYAIELFDWKTKGWRKIVVDDRIATKSPDSPDPCFVKASCELEIYPMLIEKAVAVMLGGFDNMNCIMPTWAFGVLTGHPDVWHFQSQNGGGGWQGHRPIYDGSSSAIPVGQVYENAFPDGSPGNAPKSNAEMWKILEQWDGLNHMMVCGCAKVGMSDDTANRWGIIHTHAYSLISVMSNVAGTGINLALCRNPHGRGGQEPNLPWKDHDARWKQYPQIAKQLNVTDASFKEDGLFWIEEKDFFGAYGENFNTIYIVKCDMQTKRRDPKSPLAPTYYK